MWRDEQIEKNSRAPVPDVLALAIKKDAFLTSEKNEWSEEEECCLSEEEEYYWSDEQEDLAEGGGYWDSSTSCYVAWS